MTTAQLASTNDSSIMSKRSAERLGYFAANMNERDCTDHAVTLLEYFAPNAPRRPPLINRSYWLRSHAVDAIVDAFLTMPLSVDDKVRSCTRSGLRQIVSLGAGYDPRPFALRWQQRQLKQQGKDGILMPFAYLELDLPPVVKQKGHLILKASSCSTSTSAPAPSALSRAPTLKAVPSAAMQSNFWAAEERSTTLAQMLLPFQSASSKTTGTTAAHATIDASPSMRAPPEIAATLTTDYDGTDLSQGNRRACKNDGFASAAKEEHGEILTRCAGDDWARCPCPYALLVADLRIPQQGTKSSLPEGQSASEYGKSTCSEHGLLRALRRARFDPRLPTLFLAECMLPYMSTVDEAEILRVAASWSNSAFENGGLGAVLVSYEQILHAQIPRVLPAAADNEKSKDHVRQSMLARDRFGRIVLEFMRQRNTPLSRLELAGWQQSNSKSDSVATGSLTQQRCDNVVGSGWHSACVARFTEISGDNMTKQRPDREELTKHSKKLTPSMHTMSYIRSIEPFDEWEEWAAASSHYGILVATIARPVSNSPSSVAVDLDSFAEICGVKRLAIASASQSSHCLPTTKHVSADSILVSSATAESDAVDMVPKTTAIASSPASLDLSCSRWGHTCTHICLRHGRHGVLLFGGFGPESIAGGSGRQKRLGDVALWMRPATKIASRAVEGSCPPRRSLQHMHVHGSVPPGCERMLHTATAVEDMRSVLIFGGRKGPLRPLGDALMLKLSVCNEGESDEKIEMIVEPLQLAQNSAHPAPRFRHSAVFMRGGTDCVVSRDIVVIYGGRDGSSGTGGDRTFGDTFVLEAEGGSTHQTKQSWVWREILCDNDDYLATRAPPPRHSHAAIAMPAAMLGPADRTGVCDSSKAGETFGDAMIVFGGLGPDGRVPDCELHILTRFRAVKSGSAGNSDEHGVNEHVRCGWAWQHRKTCPPLPRMFGHEAQWAGQNCGQSFGGKDCIMLVVGGVSTEPWPVQPFPALFAVHMDTYVACTMQHGGPERGVSSWLLHAHSTAMLPCDSDVENDGPNGNPGLVVSGGGGNCFIFGSYLNPAVHELFGLTLDDI